MEDKFNIIENHINNFDEHKQISKINNFFENYIFSDTKILLSDYFLQLFTFYKINKDLILSNIYVLLKKYLSMIQNNIRNKIKKDEYSLDNLCTFIESYLIKIKYINSIINDKVIEASIRLINDIIITDTIIMTCIDKSCFSNLNNNNNSDIINFIKFLEEYSNYDEKKTLNKILNYIDKSYYKYLISIENLPIPDNISRLNKLNDYIKLVNIVNRFYKSFNFDINKIIMNSILESILEIFIEILKKNTLLDIDFVFNNYYYSISKLIFYKQKNQLLFDKDIYIKKILTELSSIITKISNESNYDINILSFIKVIRDINIDTFNKEIFIKKLYTILSNPNILENIIINIDKLITTNQLNDISSIIYYFRDIKDKDVFINIYKKYLIKRCLNNLMTGIDNIQNENKLIDYLSHPFGNSNIYKLRKIIEDTKISLKYYYKYKINNSSILITSYSVWDINQNEGLIDFDILKICENTQLIKIMKDINILYVYDNMNKILNWFPHFGEVNITYLNQVIIMLPIQFMILELFDFRDEININEIINSKLLSKYNTKFKMDIVNSLISGNILVIKNNILKLGTDNINNNLIDVFLNISDYSIIAEQKRIDDFVHSRIDIVNVNINHILKREQLYKYQLFNKVKNIITLFELDDTIFNKSIDYLEKRDFIQIDHDNNMIQKLNY